MNRSDALIGGEDGLLGAAFSLSSKSDVHMDCDSCCPEIPSAEAVHIPSNHVSILALCERYFIGTGVGLDGFDWILELEDEDLGSCQCLKAESVVAFDLSLRLRCDNAAI